MNNWRRDFIVLVGLPVLATQAAWAQTEQSKDGGSSIGSSVGMSSTIQGLVLPGTELEVKPLNDDDSPIVLRIKQAYIHGSSFRYDLVYYGLEPGQFDLRDNLQRKDGSTTDNLPAIPVTITSMLEPGQTMPNELETRAAPRVGGYKVLLVGGGLIWLFVLLLLILGGRKKNRNNELEARRPKSLAEQLRPLVESAIEGELPDDERAELEHLLLSYWQQKLDVDGLTPSQAIRKLKSDPVAGQLLTALEEWFHNPNASKSHDVAQLLEPYRTATPVLSTE